MSLPSYHIDFDSVLSRLLTDLDNLEMQTLLEQDPAILDARDKDGQTCLHIAITCVDFAGIEALLDVGASKTLKDIWGRRAVEHADHVHELMKKARAFENSSLEDSVSGMLNLLSDD